MSGLITLVGSAVASTTAEGADAGRLPVGVLAHGGDTEPHHLLETWPFAPGIVVALVTASVLWLVARRRPGHRGGDGWWWSGIAVLALALLTPLHPVGDRLLSFHMVQHLLLGLIAPVLLVRSRPVRVLSGLLPSGPRRELSRLGTRIRRLPGLAAAVVLVHVGVWWAWHVPVLYDAAITDELVHSLEHLSLFAVGLALFGLAWPAGPVRRRSGAGLFMVFVSAFGTGALSALITFSPTVHYATDSVTAEAWSMTRLEDQQLGGAIMWVPGGLVYLGVAVALFTDWLERRPTRDPGVEADGIVLEDPVVAG